MYVGHFQPQVSTASIDAGRRHKLRSLYALKQTNQLLNRLYIQFHFGFNVNKTYTYLIILMANSNDIARKPLMKPCIFQNKLNIYSNC